MLLIWPHKVAKNFSPQVTTHGHLLQREELEKVAESVHMKVEGFLLQEFDTELDFSNKVWYVSCELKVLFD